MAYFNSKKFWLRRLAVSLSLFIGLMLLTRYPGFKNFLESDRAIPMADVTEVMIVSLHREVSARSSSKVLVHLYGEIDGHAVIEPLENHQSFSTYPIGPGRIDFKVEIPWDQSKLSLRYTPEDVKAGMLNVKYRFE